MKKLTVEPVPTPMTVPSLDVLERRFGGALLLLVLVHRRFALPPETTVPAFAGTVVKFRIEQRTSSLAAAFLRPYFFFAAFFLVAFFLSPSLP